MLLIIEIRPKKSTKSIRTAAIIYFGACHPVAHFHSTVMIAAVESTSVKVKFNYTHNGVLLFRNALRLRGLGYTQRDNA